MARQCGVPLATLLRGATPPAAVPVSALLAGESPAALLASARAALARGFSVLKIKVGRPDGAAWELAALRALRLQLGPAVTLRLDANRAWSLAEATARLDPLVELAPELIEEPLSQVRELPHLRTSLPVALDEQLTAHAALGNSGWGYRELLPYFKRLEAYPNGNAELHGQNGPVTITQGEYRNALSDSFLAACAEIGINLNDDFNGRAQEGAGYYHATISRGTRRSIRPRSSPSTLSVRKIPPCRPNIATAAAATASE